MFANTIPDLRFKIQYRELSNLLQYLNRCYIETFAEPFNVSRFEPYRESLLHYHTGILINKTMLHLFNNRYKTDKPILFKITEAERITFSVLSKRCEVPAEIIHLQTLVLNKLNLLQSKK